MVGGRAMSPALEVPDKQKMQAALKLQELLPDADSDELCELLPVHGYNYVLAAEHWMNIERQRRQNEIRKSEKFARQLQKEMETEAMHQWEPAEEKHRNWWPQWGTLKSTIVQKDPFEIRLDESVAQLMEYFEDNYSDSELKGYLEQCSGSVESVIDALMAEGEEQELKERQDSDLYQLQTILVGWSLEELENLLDATQGIDKALCVAFQGEDDATERDFLQNMFPDIDSRRIGTVLKRHDKETSQVRMQNATQDLIMIESSRMGEDVDQDSTQFVADLARNVKSNEKKLQQLEERFSGRHESSVVATVFELMRFRYLDAAELLEDMLHKEP